MQKAEMPDAPNIPVSLRLQITMFSKGFHGYLSLTSMVLKCISHLLHEKIFILKSSELYMKSVQLLSFAITGNIPHPVSGMRAHLLPKYPRRYIASGNYHALPHAGKYY